MNSAGAESTVALETKGSSDGSADAEERNRMTSPSKRIVSMAEWYRSPSETNVSNLHNWGECLQCKYAVKRGIGLLLQFFVYKTTVVDGGIHRQR
jgi:hypothetical protein